MAKIILAGGSGFLGQILSRHYREKGDEVVVLTRHPHAVKNGVLQVGWDAKNLGNWIDHLDNSDILINLTGKSVNCRYTERNKKEIFASRLDATQILGKALQLVSHPPPIWLNAASATIYRHAEDCPQDEYTGEVGTGFSVEVCQQWEKAFFSQITPGIRKIALRLAIVLGKNGGVMPYFRNLAKFGLGGKQGNGQQYFSWVHEHDVTGIIDFLVSNPDLEGVFNVSAPNPLPNYAFMQAVRKVVNAPFSLDTPKWVLQIGSVFIRTETELILKSRWVLPRRLTEAGYNFAVPTIQAALAAGV